MQSIKTFRLANQNRYFGGVCAGIAYHLLAPLWIVRALVFLATVASCYQDGWAIYVLGLYVLLWMFVPRYDTDPADFNEVTGSNPPELDDDSEQEDFGGVPARKTHK